MPGREIKLLAAGFLLALLSSFRQTFFIALFGGQIRADLGLTHGAFGSLYALATLVSGLAGAVDQINLRAYATIGAVLRAAACLLLALTGTTNSAGAGAVRATARRPGHAEPRLAHRHGAGVLAQPRQRDRAGDRRPSGWRGRCCRSWR